MLIEDHGALDFVIRARLERQYKDFYQKRSINMNSLYRTMFFVPGNDPKKIIGAEIYRPDCIIYDLEDSVSIFEKDSARILVKYALQYNRPDCRVGIRINQADSPYYEDDVSSMVPLQPDFLRLQKQRRRKI